jgi:type IV pilus assembly protein PilW
MQKTNQNAQRFGHRPNIRARHTERDPLSWSYRMPKDSGGFTLVEILVAMVISLFLIGGVVQLFVQNKTSYKLQEGIARAQENGRLSIYFLEKNIRRAGYPWDGTGAFVGFERDKASTGAFTDDNQLPTEGITLPDTLVMQYEAPPGGATDCTGRDIGEGKYISMQFLISDGGLKCETSTTESFTPILSSAVLINDVTDLQFTYGLDSNKDGIPDDTPYVNANSIAADEWDQVVSVRAQLTVSVEPAALSDNGTMQFSTTIPIRNHIDPN